MSWFNLLQVSYNLDHPDGLVHYIEYITFFGKDFTIHRGDFMVYGMSCGECQDN